MTAVASMVLRGAIAEDVDLASLTTYKFGGPTRFFCEAEDEATLLEAAASAQEDGVRVLILGRGSNLVISDGGFDGLVVRLGGGLGGIEVDQSGEVVAGAAAALPAVARRAAESGRGGLEFFVGIPGSVGGAVRMNAGCHGSETRDHLITARVVDLRTGTADERTPDRLGLGYRHSDLIDSEVVIAARFATTTVESVVGFEKMRQITRWRRIHQPGGTFNAGSVFKNPEGDAAGRLIDAAGLKGFRMGGASVSERHANFFVADETARAQDVYDLVWAVRRRVGESFGTWLVPELRFVGEFVPSADEQAGP